MRLTFGPSERSGGLASRWRVAGEWERLLATAEDGPRQRRFRVHPLARRMLAAHAEIEQLTSVLFSLEPVDPRGVAMAHRLATDGAGPVYDLRSRRSLPAAIEACIGALEPAARHEMPDGSADRGAGRTTRGPQIDHPAP